MTGRNSSVQLRCFGAASPSVARRPQAVQFLKTRVSTRHRRHRLLGHDDSELDRLVRRRTRSRRRPPSTSTSHFELPPTHRNAPVRTRGSTGPGSRTSRLALSRVDAPASGLEWMSVRSCGQAGHAEREEGGSLNSLRMADLATIGSDRSSGVFSRRGAEPSSRPVPRPGVIRRPDT